MSFLSSQQLVFQQQQQQPLTINSPLLYCKGAVWQGQDLSPCVQRRYLNFAVPLILLACSSLILVLQKLSTKRRKASSASRIAQLDPSASNVINHETHNEDTSSSRRNRQMAIGNLLSRALTALMPLNGSRLASRWRDNVRNGGPSGRRIDNQSSRSSNQALSNTSLAVFRTENAVILNEVQRVLRQGSDQGRNQSEGFFLSQHSVEQIKRSWEAFGSVLALSLCVAGTLYGGEPSLWIVFWAYLTMLSILSLVGTSSFFTHKAFSFAAAFLISVWNLRSTLIRHDSDRFDVVHKSIYALACGITLLPSLIFPLQSPLPMRLRAIQETIHSEPLYGEARTAIPTPHRRVSPTTSFSGGDAGAIEAADQAKEFTPLIPSPENRASVLSRALFEFVTPLIVKHYRVQFTVDAVPDLPPASHAAAVIAAYRSQSSNDVPTKRQKSVQITPQDADDDDDYDEDGRNDDENARLLDGYSTGTDNDDTRHAKRRNWLNRSSLRWKLARHFAPMLALQMFWAAIEAVASLAAPLAMRLILGYIADRSRGDRNMPFHMAVLFSTLLLVGGLANATAASQALIMGRKISVQMRAILVFEIVNKTLRRRDTGGAASDEEKEQGKKKDAAGAAKEKASERTSDGEVTNLVAVDVFRVSEIGAYLHFLFPLSPIQVLLCTVFLIDLLGVSAVAGLATLIIAMPLQAFSARFYTLKQQKMLKAIDQRLNLANEVLTCIKTVKFFAWEKPFEQKMKETREKELQALKHRYYAWIINLSLYLSVPTFVTLITFTVHTVVRHQPLPAETAFTALALFNSLRTPLDALPDMIINVLSAFVSLRRIDKFLSEEETTKYEQLMSEQSPDTPAAGRVETTLSDGEPSSSTSIIGFSRATFTYTENDEELGIGSTFCLRDLNIEFPRGELTIIAGPVGSGKTTLLLSLLGETRRIAGRTYMPCAVARTLLPVDRVTGLSESIAYCPQSPWLLGATVKENILFGQPYNDLRYRSVVKACALETDLDILEYGDETEVGEKGTALSGGQKARVALARAIYSPARYILLDDVLSAVDAHTAKHLYRHCLKGALLKGRTVIMVTHAVALCLPGAKLAVALHDGRVVASGTPSEMRASGVFEEDLASGAQTPVGRNKEQRKDQEQEGGEDDDENAITVEELTSEVQASKLAEMTAKREKKALHANIETYGKGNVGFKAYKLYVCSFAASTFGLLAFWAIYVFFFASSRLTDVANAAWLRQWASTYEQDGADGSSEEERFRRTRFYLGIYGLLALVYVLCSLGRDVVAIVGSLRASRRIYKRLLKTILHARPQWFDRTPIGRIMNRLSKDVETIDQDVTMSLIFFIDVCLQSVIIMGVACFSLPIFTLFAIVISLAYWLIGALYIVSSRDLKRLESVTRSPIFTLVGEVLSGAVVIRAYGDASRFTRHCLRLIDKNNRAFYMLWCENRWLSIRVDYLATITSFAVALFLVAQDSIDAAMAGFTLSFTTQLVSAVLWVMRMYTQLEINANSVERVDEYLGLEQERFGQGVVPPAAWPSKQRGSIEVRDLCVRYAPELPLVLRNVSFSVKAGEKVGICGRTGSGKSSLALALFRFLEAESGSITIDGLDLSQVALENIRARLTIIPQEAQLFSGTVRFNLDPFGTYEDAILWDVLQRCRLVGSNATDVLVDDAQGLPSGISAASTTASTSTPAVADEARVNVITSLDMTVEQGGKNFSAGQRQLIALARGLLKLRTSNIVILDESTASLDAGSDAAVQRTIRSEMHDSTMLVVAHRIRGIVSFDKVLVLDAGDVVEFDRPSTLLRKEGGAFRDLCLRSGEFDLLSQLADEADSERALAAATGGPIS